MKINIFQWRYSPFLLLGFGVFGADPAYAVRVQCDTPRMEMLTFAAVDSLSTQTDATAKFTLNCSNQEGTRTAKVCVNIGGEPRQMMSGSDKLNFQLFQDLGHTIVWGSQYTDNSPLKFDVKLGPYESKSFERTLYGRVLAGQTGVAPGTYTQKFEGNDARVTVHALISGSAPVTCNPTPNGSLYIPFTVKVPMIKSCQVTTTGALDLGSVTSGSIPTPDNSSASIINVTCTNSTPYKIGLAPSNGNVEGMGVMSSSTSADPVYYQLRSTAGIDGKVWGNDNDTSPISSNRVTRVGNGAVQGETVYATVSNTDVKPGNYSDIVTVHVDY